ncbi:MAG: cobalamin-dependent protein [Rhodothermia bacterium]|nr:cobalamin-dependent protein [Rhodothermia bacterium]
MLVRDAIPRRIDVLESLGVSAKLVAEMTSDQLVTDHPELGEIDRLTLESDIARLLEALAIATETGGDAPFVQHALWLSAINQSRGLPPNVIEDELLQLRRLLRQSLKGTVGHNVGLILDRALLGLHEKVSEQPEHTADTVITLTSDLLLTAVLRADRDRALAVVDDGIRSGLKVLDTYVGVIQPVMERIGLMWQDGSISVSEEHVATALVQSVMAHCKSHFRSGPGGTRGRLALTGVPGELHELGLQVVGDVAEADGWRVHYLGTNAPTGDTLEYLKEQQPDIIGISVTMPYNIAAATALAEGIRSASILRGATVFAGGQAAPFNSSTWKSLAVISEENMDAGRFVALAKEHAAKN